MTCSNCFPGFSLKWTDCWPKICCIIKMGNKKQHSFALGQKRDICCGSSPKPVQTDAVDAAFLKEIENNMKDISESLCSARLLSLTTS